MKIRYKIVAGVLLLSGAFWAGYELSPEKEKVVEKTQYRDRVRTVIEERPDGSKTTIIDREVRKDVEKEQTKTVKKLDKWSVGLSAAVSRDFKLTPVYTLTVQRKLILGLSGGLYGRTDGELGVVLSYSF